MDRGDGQAKDSMSFLGAYISLLYAKLAGGSKGARH